MKKLFLSMYIIFAVCCTFGLTACDDRINGHEHRFVDYFCEICYKAQDDAPFYASLDYLIFSKVEDNNGKTVGYSVSGSASVSEATAIYIPKYCKRKPVTKIESSAFEGCGNLTSIEIPGLVTSIGQQAFSLCTKLTSIEIPDSVTSIGASAFRFCFSLKSIEIPDSVTSIGQYAFSSCTKLSSVIFKNRNGWSAGGTELPSAELVNPSIAAKYLTQTYADYTWSRS